MIERAEKTQLLNEIRTSYANFEAILASLSPEQMTTPGVNDSWSIKDNIAHLSAWQHILIDRLQALRNHTVFHSPWAGMNDDDINEQFYQQNKSRSLDDVLAEFRSLYQQVLEQVQALSDEDLNKPQSEQDTRPIWPFIVGNTNEHVQEHAQIIQDWLANHNK